MKLYIYVLIPFCRSPYVEYVRIHVQKWTQYKNRKIYIRAFKGTVYWKLWNVESNRYISLVGKLFLMETTMRGALNKLLSLHNILIVILSKYHAYSIGLLMDKLNGATWLTIAIFWHFFKLNWKIHLSACWLPPIHTYWTHGACDENKAICFIPCTILHFPP